VRYADDFVVLVHGTRAHAEALWEQMSDLLAPMGLRLAPDKTQVVHLDEGFDFLGFRIQRHIQKGGTRSYVYSYPSRKSVQTMRRKLKAATKRITHQPADQLFKQVNPMVAAGPSTFGTAQPARPMPPSATICGGGSGPGCCINIPAPVNALSGPNTTCGDGRITTACGSITPPRCVSSAIATGVTDPTPWEPINAVPA